MPVAVAEAKSGQDLDRITDIYGKSAGPRRPITPYQKKGPSRPTGTSKGGACGEADWLPFKAGEVMYTDGIKTSSFIRGVPRTSLSYIIRIALMHFIEPYSGYIAMNSAGRKGCESLVLELLNDSGR